MADFFKDRKQKSASIINALTPIQYQDIHLATLKVLANTGLFVEDPEAIEIFSSHGAKVDNKNIVKIPPKMVEDAIQSTPAKITLDGIIPERDVDLDGTKSVFLNFPGQIRLNDLQTGAVRSSTKADLVAATRLCDALDEVDIYTRAVYPLDQPQELLHLHTAEACLVNTTKHTFHGPESQWEAEKIIAMAEAAVGGSRQLEQRKPITFAVAVSSPLKLSRKFCEVAMTAARFGFTTEIASMVMGGSTGPIHLAGAVVQTNAEILSGMVLTQLIRKGVPVIYASFSTGMDLRFGTAPFGSPEAALIASSVAGLCEYYQLPCLVPGIASDSKQSGNQTAHEKTLSGLSAAMSGADIIIGIGGLDSGMTFDFGQAVLDTEIVRMIKHYMNGIEINDETLSADAIGEIGHFDNFLTHRSTLTKMKTMSITNLFDRSNREAWEAKGKPQSHSLASSKAINILETHKPIPLSNEAIAKMQNIVNEAEKESNLA